MKIALTGGTGFIGGYLLKRLIAEGHAVRAFVRPGREEALDVPAGADVETQVGDLTDVKTVRGLTKDCDKLIHLASYNDVGMSMKAMRPLHIEGTQALYDDALENAPDSFEFIIFSSALLGLTVYSEWRDSKRVQEKIPRGGDLDSASFRPTQVYGVGDQRFTGPWLRKCAQQGGAFKIPHDGQALVNPVHVEDLVDVVIRYFDFDRAVDCVYEIAGPKGISYNEYFDLTVAAAGGSVRRKNISNRAMGWRMFLKGLTGKDVTQDRRTYINSIISHEHDISNARHELDWEPRPYSQGIKEVAAGDWWRHE